ncbi:MAG: RNA polymerase sigma factor SigZ, partial [Campylobacteraceae bacterium]|nr:RNA polymerase sigma factor SigZ [Campylobacteraceae bacterium]
MKKIISDLYLQFRKPLLYFIRNKMRDKNIAEDLLQEVFIKASNNIHSLKDEQKVQSWLYKISINIIIDYVRKNTIPNISFEEMNFKEEMESYIL